MAKAQKKSNKEVRKPKKPAPPKGNAAKPTQKGHARRDLTALTRIESTKDIVIEPRLILAYSLIALLAAAGIVGIAYRWYHARDRSLQRARRRELDGAATALAARAARGRPE